MGHSDLLVTQTLLAQQCWGRPRGSVRRASGLVQTRMEPYIFPPIWSSDPGIVVLCRLIITDPHVPIWITSGLPTSRK